MWTTGLRNKVTFLPPAGCLGPGIAHPYTTRTNQKDEAETVAEETFEFDWSK